ncbi:MAG: hypothetical protein Q8P77_00690, partial [Candidatus Veblenbacteria bacterium]|nr:hypothetical protein [Candidatus Veblenbacteria bacterium]
SSLWKFSGYHVDENGKAPKRVAGAGKLEYNSRLRSMLWRVGGSLLKAGIRYYCTKCGEQRPPASETEELKCAKCGGKEFKPKSISKFAEYYHEQKNLYYVKFYNRGVKIVKASELPKDEEGKRYEPADMISEGHIHAMALRKMLKLFLSCLWQVWRQAEGLPLTEPYAKAKAGHPHVIDPWSMIDKPAKKVG